MRDKRVGIALMGPYPPTIGGVATYIQHMIHSPLRFKYDFIPVQTMSRFHGTMGYSKETCVHKIVRILGDTIALIRTLRRSLPGIVHINTSFDRGGFERDVLNLFISKVFRKKVLFQIHGGRLDKFKEEGFFLTRWLLPLIFKMADTVAVLSDLQKRPFQSGDVHRRVRVFPNMIDVGQFQADLNEVKPYPFPENRVIITFVAARFYKEKGIFELIQAARIVSAVNHRVLFILVGDGDQKQVLQRICENEGIGEYVRFTGFLDGISIKRILKASDIFVLPSHAEGFPFVILEAMCAGLPIVATGVGAIPEMIEDGKNGYVIDVGDAVTLAEKLLFIAKNKGLRESMSRENLEKVEKTYDSRIVVSQFDAAYRSLLHR